MSYYDILGVSKTCSDTELKKVYHKIAFKNHPDKNKDSPETDEIFKKATEAYEILSNKEKRQLYDENGDTGTNVNEINHMDIFTQLFGSGFWGGFWGQDLSPVQSNMIEGGYGTTSVTMNGTEKVTRKTVHTPSGVRTTEYRENITHPAPTNIDILQNMSRLGFHSRRV
tara:strand:+ start:3528 stop:4034 length:507 start_codon:yes stop_codon:yes gene_type:complete